MYVWVYFHVLATVNNTVVNAAVPIVLQHTSPPIYIRRSGNAGFIFNFWLNTYKPIKEEEMWKEDQNLLLNFIYLLSLGSTSLNHLEFVCVCVYSDLQWIIGLFFQLMMVSKWTQLKKNDYQSQQSRRTISLAVMCFLYQKQVNLGERSPLQLQVWVLKKKKT